jgi:hypothetical protein
VHNWLVAAGVPRRPHAVAPHFDQAHLTLEFRRLVGASPGEFVARTERERGLHHDHAAGFQPLGVEQGRTVA